MFNTTKLVYLSLGVVFITVSIVTAKTRYPFVLDERFVCNIKQSCVECLKLTHCSWCVTNNRCFSKELPTFTDFCKNDTIDFKDNGFSIEENAECSCGSSIEDNCRPPEMTEGEVCSGRGSCVCGRCICNPNSDPEHPTKTIVGEYCDYDNFSCVGRHCNEGPYPLSQARNEEDPNVADVEQPSEVID
ncbi:Integrin beta pat-3 [Papilio xuthus]|uniref:Integrin beta pat-3 n=1 Tax=Papilio xuthus TaxID=66420 RepID=A0A194Q8G2_PAPXU|nr:Integrin beta pat-3 [Papilio xuthus]